VRRAQPALPFLALPGRVGKAAAPFFLAPPKALASRETRSQNGAVVGPPLQSRAAGRLQIVSDISFQHPKSVFPIDQSPWTFVEQM
jgi:hypothetical protein